MTPYSMKKSVRLNTQMSLGQNSLTSPEEIFSLRKSLVYIHPQMIYNVGIRYCLHQFKQFSLIPYIAFIIYMILIITTGVLIVYFTTPDKRVNNCPATYRVLITDINNRDSNPQYVVLGDVNNDTKLDVVVVTTGMDSVKILLTNRNGTFVDNITLLTGVASQPYSVALGHFNHDRCLDMAVANYGSHNVMIFVGDCRGHFQNHSIHSTGPSQPVIIKTGNLNNDEWLDLIVTNNGTESISVLLGRGDGTFTDPVRYSTNFDSFPHDISIGDINNDGQADILVANYGTDNVGIHLGNGNGTFASQMTLSTGPHSRPYSLALTDLNRDHQLDIVVANTGTGTVSVFLGHGNGTFARQTTVFTDIYGPVQLAIDDLNNDDCKDIAIVSTRNNTVYMILGYDNGTFGEQLAYSTDLNSQPWSLALADINDDNLTDVVVANRGTNTIGVLLGYDPGLFRNQTTYSTTIEDSWPYSTALADVNNDTILDIISVDINTAHLCIFLGYGDGTFASAIIYSTGSNSVPYDVAVGDFNEDTRLDIAVVNSRTNNIGIFLGYGNGSFQKQKTFSTGRNSAPNSIDIGDFNKDKHLDIVVTNQDTDNVGLFLGYGNGSFAKQKTLSTGDSSRPYSIVVADFNNDQQQDIAVANNGDRAIGLFLGYGNGSFTKQKTFSSGRYSPIYITTSDMNNDNQTDIIVTTRHEHNQLVGIFLGVGNGSFDTTVRYSTGEDSSPLSLSIGDVNNDHCQDIILANYNRENIGILLGYCDGTFALQQTYTTGEESQPTSISLGDLNNDHRLDIVVTNYRGLTIGVFLGYSRGTLKNPKTFSTGSSARPQSVISAHFNHDNQLDIAVANIGTNNIDVFIKSVGFRFNNKTSYETGEDSLPNAIITGDFNGDSNMDIAAVNLGNDNIGLFLGHDNGTFAMGTFFSTGSASQPCAIAAGDLNNDTYMDVVVSNYAANNIGVFLGYKYPNHRIDGMYSTGRFSHPSHISIGDLNNDQHADAVVIDSNTDSMLIYLGYGDGTFTLPIIYRIDPAFDPLTTIIADFNNDNRSDIVVCFSSKGVSVYLGYGNGTMGKAKIYSTGDQSRPRDIRVADFNHDNRMDVVLVADAERHHVIVLLGRGDGTFTNRTNYFTGLNSWRLSVSIADFNNDHHLDIVVSNFEFSNIGIFLGYGNGRFASQVKYSTGKDSAPTSIFISDLNNDNHLDIVVVNARAINIGIFFGRGNGSFARQKTYPLPLTDELTYDTVTFGDFNNDNLFDIAATSIYDSKVLLLLGYRNYTFELIRSYDIGYRFYLRWIVATDLNHDHVLDLIVADQTSASLVVLLGSCCDVLLHQTTFSTGIDSGSHAVIINDFNTDGILDVAVANLLTENIGVLLGYGNGSFDTQITYSTGFDSRPYALATGDSNNDTYLDIFVANYGNATIGVLFGYGNGTFGNYITHSTGIGSRPNAMIVLDFNNDQRLDIAITNDGTNSIVILFGDGHGNFGSLITYQTGYSTLPCALAVGDYNNDNEPDIVVTECGSNSIGMISKFC